MNRAGKYPTLVATVVLLSSTPSAAQDTFATKLLTTVCSANASEPACSLLEDLSEDQAWVILRTACRTDTSDACKTFLAEQGGSLLFDARNKSWSAFWERERLELKFDVAGVPTLRLRPRDAKPLKVIVTNLSPLVYSAKAGTPKEEDLAVITGLKSVLALAGTGVQALLQSAASAPAPGLAAILDGLDQVAFIEKPLPPPPPKACSIPSPDVAGIARAVSERNLRLVELNGHMRALEKKLDELSESRNAFIRAQQKAEDGGRVTSSELVSVDLGAVDNAYKLVTDSGGRLAEDTDLLTSCQPLMTSYLTALASPPDDKVLRALVAEVRATETSCRVPALRSAVTKNAEALVSCDSPATSELERALKLHVTVMKPHVERLLNARQTEEKVWQAIDRVRTGKEELVSGAATLNRQVQRGLVHTWRGVLIKELAVTRPNPTLGWSKVQSHSVVIKAESPYVKNLSLAHGAEEKHEYKLESATGRILGYSIGVIHTPLYESTWTAVTAPGTTTKIIAETKRETRSGDLAAFVTYRFMEHSPANRRVQPIVEFGGAVTSARPGFFLGGGLEVLRAGRVGVGWSPQRVTVLSDTQRVNETVVTSNDDIKTEKRFDVKNWYLSFTFALDSLSLFNKS
jgi:hypothetical protein